MAASELLSGDRFGPYRSSRRPSTARSDGAASSTRGGARSNRIMNGSESFAMPSLRDAWLRTLQTKADLAPAGAGAPPRTGKPPTASTSAFLNGIMEKIEQRQMDASDAEIAMSPSVRNRHRGAPADGRDPEAYRDEIFQLKKELLAFRMERDLLRSRIHQLQRECKTKDTEVESLLASAPSTPRAGLAPSTPRAGLATKLEDSRIVTALKQQARDLREQLQERDELIVALQTDIRSTNAEELRLAAATLYQELQRLRILLESRENGEGDHSGAGHHDPTGMVALPLAASLQTAKEEIKTLSAKNALLAEELAAARDQLARLQRQVDGAELSPELAEQYRGVGRAELIKALQLSESERTLLREKHESAASELALLTKYNKELPQLAQRMEALQARQAELVTAKETELRTMQSLAELQRVHTSSSSEQLADLQNKQLTLLQQREQELAALQAERDHLRQLETKAQEHHRAGEMLAADRARLLAEAQREREAIHAQREHSLRSVEEERTRWLAVQEQRMAEQTAALLASVTGAKDKAGKAGKDKTGKGGKGSKDKKDKAGASVEDPEEAEREQAAVTFQTHWRRRQGERVAASLRAELAPSVVRLQAVLRGHLARKRLMRALQQQAGGHGSTGGATQGGSHGYNQGPALQSTKPTSTTSTSASRHQALPVSHALEPSAKHSAVGVRGGQATGFGQGVGLGMGTGAGMGARSGLAASRSHSKSNTSLSDELGVRPGNGRGGRSAAQVSDDD